VFSSTYVALSKTLFDFIELNYLIANEKFFNSDVGGLKIVKIKPLFVGTYILIRNIKSKGDELKLVSM